MAKKDKIMDRLHALQPNVPTKTRTRASASKEKPAQEMDRGEHSESSRQEPQASPETSSLAPPSQTLEAPVAIKESAPVTVKPVMPVMRKEEEPLVPVPDKPIEHGLVVRENLPGYLVLMVDSFSEMEKLRGAMLNEIGNIHSLVFDAWTRSLIISYDIARTNYEYIMNLAMQSFTGGKGRP